MTDILLVVDNLYWGGHHAARAVANLVQGKYSVEITDIDGLSKKQGFDYSLIMAWLDSAEVPVYEVCREYNINMASRIAGWKGVWRTCRIPPKIHGKIMGVVCCNPELQISAEKIYPRNVVTIMNGVNTNVFKPSRRYAHGGSWLWIGRTHDEQKDYGLLQQVDKEFKGEIDIIDQVWEKGKVVKTDWPKEMINRYQAAKGYIRTSRNEGSSNCLLEAMACGLPVVATPTGVAPRLLPPRSLATSAPHIVKAMREFNTHEYAEKAGAINRNEVTSRWQWRFRGEPYRTFFEKCMEVN